MENACKFIFNVEILRESALQNADDEGQTSAKKVKRKRPDVTDEATQEERPVKHRKNMAEERIKMKRTLFVGNLPPSCTKKVLQFNTQLKQQSGILSDVSTKTLCVVLCFADAFVSVQAGWRHRVGPLPFSGASSALVFISLYYLRLLDH